MNDQSTLVQVMAWCHQATSHYLSQCWPKYLLPYDVTRLQWVNIISLMSPLLADSCFYSNLILHSNKPYVMRFWNSKHNTCTMNFPHSRYTMLSIPINTVINRTRQSRLPVLSPGHVSLKIMTKGIQIWTPKVTINNQNKIKNMQSNKMCTYAMTTPLLWPKCPIS